MIKAWLLTLAALCVTTATLFVTAGPGWAQIEVTERNTVIPTYEVLDADPNPIFFNGRRYQGAQGRVYPYPLLHNLTSNKIDQSYREVILENEHVKVSFLPELGGRVYYARDKKNGYNYLYHNEVVKPALIGMTGAWISGGVEWNIPHHHRATSFTDVDYTITENDDGSVTVWVGETEWRHRTRWIVGVTLHPESTLFETTIRVFNTTPFQNSLLVFANAAVHANEDYQVIFPPETQWATYHRKNQFSQWPVSYQFFDGEDYTNGVDVSRWVNHTKSTSFFEWGNMGNFIAGIDHGENAGTVIFGDKHINPGKKLWSWGNNPSGAMWDDLLTDENGPYIELMFGSYSDNQPDYSWMQTGEAKEATYWFAPLRDLRSVKRANNDLIIDFYEESGTIHFGANATRSIPGARIEVIHEGEAVYQTVSDLKPDESWLNSMENCSGYDIHDLTFIIRDDAGSQLISYSPGKLEEEPMPEPVSPLQDVASIGDADSLYYQGLYYEQFHDAFYDPQDFYERAIELNPQHVQALLRNGVLYLKAGDYEHAAGYLERAVERVAWDYVTPERADPLYYLALAYLEMGRTDEAYDLLYKSVWDYNFRTPGYYQMALMKSREGDYQTAIEHLEMAYITNIQSVEVLGLKASLYRLTGQPEKAGEVTAQLIDIDPLNFRGYYEQYLLTGNRQQRQNLATMMRDDRESYLELAVLYGNAGLYDEALDILDYAVRNGNERLRTYPIIHYYLGYYHHKLGNRSEAGSHFADARRMPHEYVFPFRFETVTVLNKALEYQPDDGLAWYYMGNIYYDHQPERAIESWEKAVALDDNIPVAHRNLAFAYANVKNDLESTMHNIERAIALNPNDPRYYYEYDVYQSTMGVPPEERLAPFAENHDVVTSDLTSLFPYVDLLTLSGEYEQAIDLMQSYHFRRWEGGGGVYPNWIYAHLHTAIDAMEDGRLEEAGDLLKAAVSYPENLQTVRNQFETIAYYYKGVLAEMESDQERAAGYFKMVASGRSRVPECRYYIAKALEKLNQPERASSVFESLVESGQDDLDREVTVDFFDPFGTVRSGSELQAEGHFKIALGLHGLGETGRAGSEFDRAIELNPAILSLVFNL